MPIAPIQAQFNHYILSSEPREPLRAEQRHYAMVENTILAQPTCRSFTIQGSLYQFYIFALTLMKERIDGYKNYRIMLASALLLLIKYHFRQANPANPNEPQSEQKNITVNEPQLSEALYERYKPLIRELCKLKKLWFRSHNQHEFDEQFPVVEHFLKFVARSVPPSIFSIHGDNKTLVRPGPVKLLSRRSRKHCQRGALKKSGSCDNLAALSGEKKALGTRKPCPTSSQQLKHRVTKKYLTNIQDACESVSRPLPCLDSGYKPPHPARPKPHHC